MEAKTLASCIPNGDTLQKAKLFSSLDCEVSLLSRAASCHSFKTWTPAARPSGDWVGVVQTDDEAFRVALVDLEGHGEGAALYHGFPESSLHQRNGLSVLNWLTDVHRSWPGPRSATAVVLDVNLARNQSRLVTAAHPAPIIRTHLWSATTICPH